MTRITCELPTILSNRGVLWFDTFGLAPIHFVPDVFLRSELRVLSLLSCTGVFWRREDKALEKSSFNSLKF
jgi:hypothetical protein